MSHCCLQAPNVSLQQLIASFAAQSKQLGLQPGPRVSSAAAETSLTGQHDAPPSSLLADSDALSASRYLASLG